jgi:Flp pilus assembly protein TadB
MNIENATLTAAWIVVVIAIVGPTLYRLIRRTYRHYRIRQHKKNLPGPLLGVVYPKTKDKK